ncbi:hypothetical protein HF325_002925 [Metschnikowia pulcherrima]|uniref:Cation/H+ exchanger transmembrane domain-containing protein n=1 Tax=Metschnikowia pulcherrima TaxID=27326 RepID=A0A8H7GRV2_9ASCO|nr:hypothetical protein HF325_002925 [Metschnikowia pulcherrima]
MAGVSTESVAGIVAGRNPLEYLALSPYTVFLFQAVLIMFFCHILHYPLKKIQQPRVIAEVLAGIILGPTVMGRIPGFTETCFSPASKVGLTLVANIGIIFFLFIVGMEVDLGYIRKNARVALSVGFINMAIPFALGCGIARGLYNEYHNDNSTTISFTTYMVFIAVALCITAFPVLARILVELNLIGDRVGTIVLSAGIINDLVGWMLLALVVTLANADNGIHTLYILLLTAAWFVFLMYPVKIALHYYLKKFTNELATGQPSQMLMVIIIAMVFISSFYTDIIGVHPIFGAFMVGVLIPRDNGYVIRITEKLEDLVHLVMIPIYFAVAGLNVDLGELNRGIDWAYVVAVIALAMVGKVAGGFLAGMINGFRWRDSLAVGVLMSCKGIVEIVVLNVGLNAKIISTRVYSMFIVMALITTFSTTPLALWVYPPRCRNLTSKWSNVLSGLDEKEELLADTTTELSLEQLDRFSFSAVILLLRKIDSLSNLLLLFKDLEDSMNYKEAKAIHLREFTSRTSHLLEASTAGEADTLLNEREYADLVSILAIIEAFSSLLRTKLLTMSLLAPMKNYVMSVNDQVSAPLNLVLKSVAIASMVRTDAESPEVVANYRKLLDECACHVGVLLTAESQVSEKVRLLLLILDHDDRLCASDLLALHFVRQLARANTKIHVYVRLATGYNKQFEQQFDLYLEESAEDVDMRVSYYKEIDEIFSDSTAVKGVEKGLFVVTSDTMQNDSGEITMNALRDAFDVLVVRAAH